MMARHLEGTLSWVDVGNMRQEGRTDREMEVSGRTIQVL
jgi:hypothetical protein